MSSRGGQSLCRATLSSVLSSPSDEAAEDLVIHSLGSSGFTHLKGEFVPEILDGCFSWTGFPKTAAGSLLSKRVVATGPQQPLRAYAE